MTFDNDKQWRPRPSSWWISQWFSDHSKLSWNDSSIIDEPPPQVQTGAQAVIHEPSQSSKHRRGNLGRSLLPGAGIAGLRQPTHAACAGRTAVGPMGAPGAGPWEMARSRNSTARTATSFFGTVGVQEGQPMGGQCACQWRFELLPALCFGKVSWKDVIRHPDLSGERLPNLAAKDLVQICIGVDQKQVCSPKMDKYG